MEPLFTPMADSVLRLVAAALPVPSAGRRVFIGVDGVDGAGKSTFADALGARLRWPVIRISLDGFHRPSRERYRQGRASPLGFFEDSYDYAAFRRLAVEPLRPGGSGRYRAASHDLASDRQVCGPELPAPNPAVVLVDGLFLHRPELSGNWDATVFLDVSFETSCRRMELRDGADPDPLAPSNRRYVGGQQIYLAACNPCAAASVVVDYNDAAAPRLVRPVPPQSFRNAGGGNS
ncbi:uridine kinase [Arthrobacter koreensis]|uniref:uridine kinase n=1 Tax=Arthrobacter koreensis TaxID=199136 RepID=UPI003D8BE096